MSSVLRHCLFFLFIALAGCEMDNYAKVTIVADPVTDLPKNEHIYISGSHIHFGEWSPDGAALLRQEDGSFKQTFLLEKNRYVEFKFTRGDWYSEAVNDSGLIMDNYRMLVERDTTLLFKIAGWKDQRIKWK